MERSPRRGRLTPALAVAVAVLLLLVALAAAGAFLLPARRGATEPAPAGPPAPVPATTAAGAPRTARYELRGGERPPVEVLLEVAATPGERSRGLMFRRELPPNTGMVFLFPQDTTAAFWMKNTLVPLSIAFVAADGRVVTVREMVPCTADPCPTYAPDGPYRYAVELPAGAFAAAGVEPGDMVVPLEPERLPQPT